MPIAGYRLYYLKGGEPIMNEGEIVEIPLTLTSMVIPLDLRDSAMKFVEDGSGNVPTEEMITKWCNEVGLEVGHT